MKLRRIEIKDYRGIRQLATDVGDAGMVVKGRNAAGKTSVLKAIRAALAAEGCDPSDIRKGADEAEILISLDKLRVRRKITANGPSLTVKNTDGDTLAKPQSRLTELLGTAALDPLDFYLAPKTKRRQLVLDALPIEVSIDELVSWGVPKQLVIENGSSGHGLEVVERYRKIFYGMRTDANRVAKDAQASADRLADAAPLVEPDDGDRAAADQELAAARAAHSELAGRTESVARMQEAQQGTRDRIASLRKSAAEAAEQARPAFTADDLAWAERALGERRATIEKIEAELAAARNEHAIAQGKIDQINAEFERAGKVDVNARRYAEQAQELEQTLAAAGAVAVTDEDRLQAEGRVTAAVARAEKASKATEGKKAFQESRAAFASFRQAEEKAEQLDKVVKALTEKAPAQLAAKSGGIPGLTIEGDRILLDGVDVDALSGAEQMRFAVQLARKLNERAKILVVDGLERLDADRALAFVKEATAGGWQLLGTRVADGELVIEAIEL